MARTKGKGSKATFHRYSSPSFSPPPNRSPSPPSPPPKLNSPNSSSSTPMQTPSSSFINDYPEDQGHASSPERSYVLKNPTKTLEETNPLAMIVHPLFLIPPRETQHIHEEIREHIVVASEETLVFSKVTNSKPKKPSISDSSLSKSRTWVQLRRSKSSQTRGTRRSTRLMFGFGTKKKPVIDTTVYDISDSDSEENSDSEDSTFIPEGTPKMDPKIVPQKVPIKSPPKKEIPKRAPTKEEKGKGKADSSKDPVEKKSTSPKARNTSGNLSLSRSKRIPLMDPLRHKFFKEKWYRRPILP